MAFENQNALEQIILCRLFQLESEVELVNRMLWGGVILLRSSTYGTANRSLAAF
jgi:hypothetical protein